MLKRIIILLSMVFVFTLADATLVPLGALDEQDFNSPYVDDTWNIQPNSIIRTFDRTKGPLVSFTQSAGKRIATVNPETKTFRDQAGSFDNVRETWDNVGINPVNQKLELTPIASNPFIKNLGEWTSLPNVPRTSPATAFLFVPQGGKKYIYCLFGSTGDGRDFARFDLDQGGRPRADISVTGGNVNAGAHYYAVVFTVAGRDVTNGLVSNVVTVDTTGGTIALSRIPKGSANCTARKIYRTSAGGSDLKLLATFNDNTTTSYTDTTDDASLGAAMDINTPTEWSVAWEFLEPIPLPASDGAALAYDGVFLYAVRGGGSIESYRYEMPSSVNPRGKWYKTATNLPSPVNRGGAMVNYGGTLYNANGTKSTGSLYVLAGANSTAFMKFTPANNYGGTWSTPGDVSATVASGGGLVWPGGNYIYAARGNGYATCWAFRVNAEGAGSPGSTWINLPDLPGINLTPYLSTTNNYQLVMTDGSSFSYPGRGKYIYARLTYSTTGFPRTSKLLRLDVTNTAGGWELLPDPPNHLYLEWMYPYYSAIMYFPDVTSIPSAGSVSQSSVGEMHLFSGANYTNTWKFDVGATAATSRWFTITSVDYTFCRGTGIAMCYPGYDAAHPNAGKYIYYAFRGDTNYPTPGANYTASAFYRYDIARNNWEKLQDAPIGLQNYTSSRLVYIDGYLYCLSGRPELQTGRYVYKIAKYNVDLPINDPACWAQYVTFDLGTTQPTSNYGASLLAVKNSLDSKNYLYFLKENYSTEGFYRLDLAAGSPTWTYLANNSMNTLPRIGGAQPQISGGEVAYDGNDKIYVMRGGWGQEFYEYTVSTDTWKALANTLNLGIGVDRQGALLYVDLGSEGRFIYIFSGNGDTNAGHIVQRYKIGSGWEEVEPTSFCQYQLAACVVPRSSPYQGIYMINYNDASTYRYDLFTKKWDDSLFDRDGVTTDGNIVTDENNNIYLFYGYAGPNFPGDSSHIWVYSTDEGRWTGLIKAPFKLTTGAKGVFVPGINTIYATAGRGSKVMYKYKNGIWSNNVSPSPVPIWRASQMALGSLDPDNNENRLVYIVAGGGTKSFYTLSVPVSGDSAGQDNAESWSGGAATNLQVGADSNNSVQLTVLNGTPYFLRAGGSDTVDRFGVNGWEIFSHIQDEGSGVSVVNGSGIFSYSYDDGTRTHDYLYCVPILESDMFMRYSFDDGTWKRVARLPEPAASCSTTAVKFDNKPWFYVYNGRWDHFLRYYPGDPTSTASPGIWDEPAFLPATVEYRSASCGYKGNIYFLRLNMFYCYNTTTDTWTYLPQLPTSITPLSYWDSRIVPVEWEGKAYLYVSNGSWRNAFYRYSISDQKWQNLSSPPGSGNFGNWYFGNGLAQYGGYIYAVEGYDWPVDGKMVWRYDLAHDRWDDAVNIPPSIATLPQGMGGRGGSLVRANDCLYLLKGGNTRTFWKYDFSSGTPAWLTVQSCPVSMNDGDSNLVYPGFGDYVYLLKGNSWDDYYDFSTVLLRYNIKLDYWEETYYGPATKVANYPDIDGPSGLRPALVNLASGDQALINKINSVNASGLTNQQFSDKLTNEVISPLEARKLGLVKIYTPSPIGLHSGSTLVYPGGNYFYALPGRDITTRMERIMPFAVGEFISKSKDVSVHNGWGAVRWVGDNLDSVKVAARTGNTSDMSDATDWQTVVDIANGASLSSSSAVKPKDKFIQYKIGFFSNDLAYKPAISQIDLESFRYPLLQELVSPPFDTTKAKNRIYNMSWQEYRPDGALPDTLTGRAIRFQVRSAKTSSELLTASWHGEQSTQQKDYDLGSVGAIIDTEQYSMDRDIILKDGTAQLNPSDIYYQTITIDNRDSVVGGKSIPLTNYQIKLTIDSSNQTFWNVVRSDGRDIRFAYQGKNGKIIRLPYYIESFDYPNEAVIYVKAAKILNNSNTNQIYLYYGVKSALSESSFKNAMYQGWDSEGYTDLAEILLGFDPKNAVSSPPGTGDLEDSDKDGFSDMTEMLFGSDPDDSQSKPNFTQDSDVDGSSDFIEMIMGSDPKSNASLPVITKDSDGDGFSDLVELLNGTNPGDANSKPQAPVLQPDPDLNKDSDGDGFTDILEQILGSDKDSPSSVPDCMQNLDKDARIGGSWNFSHITTSGSNKYVVDESNSGADGLIEGNQLYQMISGTDSKLGDGALYLNKGTGIRVPSYASTQFNPALNGTKQVTIESWVKFSNQTADYARLFKRGNWASSGWEIQLNNIGSNSMSGGFPAQNTGWTQNFAPNVSYQVGKWTHLVISMDINSGGLGSSFSNGKSLGDNSDLASNYTSPETVPFDEGTRSLYLATQGVNATLDHVRIYKRRLDPGEVLAHYEMRKYTPYEPQVTLDHTPNLSGVFSSWQNRQPLVITFNYPDDREDQTGIITIDNTPATADFWNYVDASGKDVRISDGYPMPYKYRILSFDYVNKKAVIFVKFPRLSVAEPDNTIYLYYNDPTATDESGSLGEFIPTGGMVGCWDFNDSANPAVAVNSWDSGLNGSITGATYDNDAKISTALKFTSSGSNVALSGMNTLGMNGDFTVVAWVKPTATSLNYSTPTTPLLASQVADTDIYMGIKNDSALGSRFYFSYRGVSMTGSNTNLLTADRWYHVAYTYKANGGIGGLFYNGVKDKEGSLSTPGSLTDPIAIGKASTQFYGVMDEVYIYKRILSESEIAMLRAIPDVISTAFLDAQANTAGAFSTDNPVIQPVSGVFYDSRPIPPGEVQTGAVPLTIDSFSASLDRPSGTDIRFQFSDDGWHWYWYNTITTSWESSDYNENDPSASPYDKATPYYDGVGEPIITHDILASFQSQHPYGDFYFRAFLHSENGIYTPKLDRVSIQTESGIDSYYLNPVGNTINLAQRDISENRFFQYKATFYSDGANPYMLDNVTVNYIEPYINVTFPNTKQSLHAKNDYAMTWTSDGLRTKIPPDTGTVSLWYSTTGATGPFTQIKYTSGPLTGQNVILSADAGTYTWNVPDVHTNALRVKIRSEEFGENLIGMSSQDSSIYNFKLTWPSSAGQRYEQGNGLPYAITWSSYGTISYPIQVYLIKAGVPDYNAGPANGNSFDLYIPQDPALLGTLWKVKIVDNAGRSDISDYYFEITPKSTITLTTPEGRNTNPLNPAITELVVGDTCNVNWAITGIVPLPGSEVSFKYYISPTANWDLPPYLDDTAMTDTDGDGRTGWKVVYDNTSGWNGAWEIPDAITYTPEGFHPVAVTIKVGEDGKRSNYASPVADMANIRISPPSITMSNPVSGQDVVWVAGDKNRTITWTKLGKLLYPLKVQYSLNYWDTPDTAEWVDAATLAQPGGGGDVLSYTWATGPVNLGIPAAAAANGWTHPVHIRVTDSHDYSLVSCTPVPIHILSHHQIKLNKPEVAWLNGETVQVTWTWYGQARKSEDNTPVLNDLVLEVSYQRDASGNPIWPPPLPNPVTISNTRFTSLLNVTPPTGGPDVFGAPVRVPEVETEQAVLRIYSLSDPEVNDMTDKDDPFTIKIPVINITGPDTTAGTLYKNGDYNITWNNNGDVGNYLTIQYRLSPDNGATWPDPWIDIHGNVPVTPASYPWKIPLSVNSRDTRDKKIQIRIQSNKWKEGAAPGESRVQTNVPLSATIVEPVVAQFTSPTANDKGVHGWVIGNTYPISWTISPGALTANAINKFKVYYATKLNPVWPGDYTPITPQAEVLASDTAKVNPATNSATTSWVVGNAVSVSTHAVTRIEVYYDATTPNTMEFRSQEFDIAPPKLEVLAIDQNQEYRIGQVFDIQWYPTGAVAYPLKLLYSYDNVTWNDTNTTDYTQAGVIHTYNDRDALDALQKTVEGACITPWTLPDHVTPEAPHTVYIKAIDSGAGAAQIKSDPPRPFNLRPPLISPHKPVSLVPDDPTELFSITDKVRVTWDVVGALRGPVLITWARSNGSVTGTIGQIPVGVQVNSIHELEWDIPPEAAGPDVAIVVDDIGWRKPGQLQSKIINQSDPFSILPEPTFNITLPTVPENVWRIGETYAINWTKTNSGASSNDFKVDIWEGDDATGDSIENINNGPIGPWTVNWYIDPARITRPYSNLRVRVYDNHVWNTNAPVGSQKNATTFSSDTMKFSIGIPSITLTYPKTEQYWALNDRPRIQWTTVGYSTPGGITVALDLNPNAANPEDHDIRIITSTATNTSPTSKSGSLDWVVDRVAGQRISIPAGQDYIDAKIIVTDLTQYDDPVNPGAKLIVTDGSAPFRIIRQPEIDDVNITKLVQIIDDPEPKTFVLGGAMKITWVPKGIKVKNVKIIYYKNGDPTTQDVIVERTPNNGEYIWQKLEDNKLVGRELILKIIGYGDEAEEDADPANDVEIGTPGIMADIFRIKGDLQFVMPVESSRVLALFKPSPSIPNLTWKTTGVIPLVKLQYSIKNAGEWEPWETIAESVANDPTRQSPTKENGYPWTMPDVLNVLKDNSGNFLKPTPLQIRVRVLDLTDQDELTGTHSVPREFTIDYCKVTWTIYDIDTYAKQSGFTVKEYLPGISSPVAVENSIPSSEFTRYYPYGTRTTEFEHNEYLTSSKTWTPENAQDMALSMYLQNRSLANVEWHVLVSPVYTVNYNADSSITDNLSITTWLEKKGKVVGLIKDERDSFHGAKVEIFDGVESLPIKTLDNPTIRDDGTFTFVWSNPGLEAGKNYFVKAHIKYSMNNMVIKLDNGAPDIEEILLYGNLTTVTGPITDPDADNDGVPDSVEIAIYGNTNTDMTEKGLPTDSDSNGVPDIQEIVFEKFFVGQTIGALQDSDNDGIDDRIELRMWNSMTLTDKLAYDSESEGSTDYPTYVSGAAIDVTERRRSLDITGQIANVASTLKAESLTIQGAIATATTALQTNITTAQTNIETAVEAAREAVQADTAKILTATEQTLPAALEAAKSEIRENINSQILNRENTVRTGGKLTIRYRTPGTSPALDIYNGKNVQVVSKAPMTSVGGASAVAEEGGTVYEYFVQFSAGWGKGDFTIVCSDAGGNMDAMIITVLGTDVEDISSQIATILGTTTELKGLKEVADMMNSQFNLIESALSKVAKDLIDEVKEKSTSSKSMDSIYDQLAGMAGQIKQISSDSNVNLSKLYNMTAEKKHDMNYLKNKTQQLKSAMEINTKMIENIAHKPVTQTWYEYK